ncbi:MAG: methyl-accepting chemotaxis protein, partial [Trichlorobacter sp.]|uniref:CHASE3 domain-containing protein n=1 Tax=Trichlorobacter sp. TaxID=2911007 RepID=UPI00256A7042|nr:methyl-accepting chemotaxis protein [Trichlorobacter sp.]
MSLLFRNLTMRWKFTIFGILATFLLLIAIAQSYRGMRATEDRVDLFVEKYQAVAFIVSEMHTQGIQAEQAIRNVILNPSDEKAMANFKKANEEFLESQKNASALAKSIGKYEQSLAKLPPLWQENSVVKDEIITLARSGNQSASIEMLAKQETPKWREIKAQIIDLQKAMKKDMATPRKEMDEKNENNLLITVAILGSTVVLINIF